MTSFRRKRGTYKVQESERLPAPNRNKKLITCYVNLLDGDTINVEIEKRSKGAVLLNEVYKRLDLVEKDYFGLVYTDEATNLTCWLETHKKIRKQKKGENILKFQLSVKFYVAEPGKLSEEYTRYLFFLQSKQDLAKGSLLCNPGTAVCLASYVVQSELGDYDPSEHGAGYVSELKLLPNQTEAMEEEIHEMHKKHAGQSKDVAEYRFLEMAKKVPMYGVDIHPAKDEEDVELQLGVMASGIVVFLNDSKMNSFSWAKIIKISFKKRRFYILVRSDDSDRFDQQIGFRISPYRACKNLWKRCVEYHTFFRLNTPRDIPAKGLLRLGSKYKYNGRTQKQAALDYSNQVRTNSSFERKPSKRYPRRVPTKASNNANNNTTRNNNNNITRNKNNITICDNNNSLTRNDKHIVHNDKRDKETISPVYITSTPTSPKHHGSTPSDLSQHSESPPFYHPKSGVEEVKEEVLNTSTPSIDLIEEREAEEDMVTIVIMPDSAGRFGFNVRGGADQRMPVLVSKVARATPAAAAVPCLEEGDQVISINHQAIDAMNHADIVNLIKNTVRDTTDGELVLVVRKISIENTRQEKLAEDTELPDDLPDLPVYRPESANLLAQSINILQKGLNDGTLTTKYNQLYKKTPGLTMNAAKLPENHSKNRFRDIAPYDTTRVRLLNSNDDYINANFVDLNGGNLSYIAAQGPMASTVDEHWQMIWDHYVDLIVMVSQCIEKNNVKCSQYWPEHTQTSSYRNIDVECVNQRDLDTCTEREFEVQCGEETRLITQLQYTDWPVHGCPEDPEHFVKFLGLVRSRRPETPILVHCSAGIGRTGVVLLLDGAMELISKKCGVYPFDIVKLLRDQRGMLVQTLSQFKFACQAIVYMYNEVESEKECNETLEKIDNDIITDNRVTSDVK